jgi:hypothetical protein
MNGWTAISAWASGLNLGVFLCTFSWFNLIISLVMILVIVLDWKAESRG